MQELLNNLYITDFKSEIIIYSIFLIILIYMAIYSRLNSYRIFEFKVILKFLSPMVLFIIALIIYIFFNPQKKSDVVNINNKDNYSLVRKGETVEFISYNEHLKNAKLKVEIENEYSIYLKYENNIFKIPKEEIKNN